MRANRGPEERTFSLRVVSYCADYLNLILKCGWPKRLGLYCKFKKHLADITARAAAAATQGR
jgi:hypothetical protein